MYRYILPTLLLVGLSLPVSAVEQLRYRILEKKPQDESLYVQGLEFHGTHLYVSAGLYGKSRLVRYNLDSGKTETVRLNPRIWAEGLTVLGEKVFQLTYKNKMMLVFDRESLRSEGWFPITTEGWGLTNNGVDLIYSDGSDKLYFISPDKRTIDHSLAVTEAGRPLHKLNELEWIDGMIWANVWQADRIVIIDPSSGEVSASIDLTGLLPSSERRAGHDVINDVLNGIARNPQDDSIWVTGKRWPWLYRIETLPAEEPQSQADSR